MTATQTWSPARYEKHARFVSDLGAPVVELLAPRAGERILDLGCGDGSLTEKIVEAGARVIGLDSSAEMVEAARARGIDAFVADGETLELDRQAERFGRFDAIFSNAALHWMTDPAAVATGAFSMLKAGGRFVGEMGGAGNLAILRAGLREEIEDRGYALPDLDPQWYPTVDEFSRVYTTAGFGDVQAIRIDRPTDLPAGIAGWVKTFRSGWLDVAGVPEEAHDQVAAAVERRLAPELQKEDGTFVADYVRLRFKMVKPNG